MGGLNIIQLAELIRRFDLKYFVETGTGYGYSLKYASTFNFKKLFSIEIDKDAYERAINIFSEDERVKLFLGNSFDVIKENYNEFDENTLFWLDAHYPGADVGKNDFRAEKNIDIRLPLEKELELLLDRSSKYTDVFILDDARIYFKDNYEAKNLDEIGYSDIAKYNGLPILQEFEKKYNIVKSTADTGYIILTPK